ncbi:MAG: hypothetical protein M3R65_05330 [Gemmatimonadota bacterium]|nr:hypothetical protein [Gemmatimonadota bacterium]
MKHRAIRGWDIRPGVIEFAARCPDPVIEEAVRRFIDTINDELRASRQLLSGMRVGPNAAIRYSLQLPAEAGISQVGPDKDTNGKPLYEYYPLRFRLDHAAIMEILMGVSLYGEPYYFLRELLQNAADTCRHRQAAESSDYRPEIVVRIFTHDGQYVLEVEDNGMGMTRLILDRYFAKVGRSYYQSADFATDVGSQAFRPISRFGIGVLSVFMVGDRLQVDTLSARGGNEPAWFVEVADEGSLFWLKESNRSQPGSRIRLHLTEVIERALPAGQPSPVVQSDGSTIQAVTPFDRVVGTIALVAPKLGIPVKVQAGLRSEYIAAAKTSLGQWGIERGLTVHESTILFETGDIEGVTGALRFYILTDPRGTPIRIAPITDVEIVNGVPQLASGAKFGEYCIAMPGVLQRMNMRAIGGAFGVQIMSISGMYTQQGFRVPNVQLFGQGATLIPSIFPLTYEIDLSGELGLSLTADRTRVMDTPQTRATIDLLARQMSERLFRQLASALQPNPELLDQLVEQLAQFGAPVALALATVRLESPGAI